MGRIEKVNQQIKKEISIILQRDMADPRFEFVSITQVDVSRDLRSARVLFSVLGDSRRAQAVQQGLDGARGMIRKLIGQRINIRYTPELSFFYDNSISYSDRIEKTLQEIHDEKNHRDNKEE